MICGVHHNTVSIWIKNGLPVTREKRRILVDVAAGVQWIRARDREELEAARAGGHGGGKERKLDAEAKLKEMQVAEREGKLRPVEEYEAELLSFSDSVREGVLGVAASAVQAGLVAAADEAALDEMLRDALRSLSKRGARA